MYSAKPKVNDLHADKLDDSHKLLTLGVDEMELRNTLLHYDHEHKQKLELVEAIHEIIGYWTPPYNTCKMAIFGNQQWTM